MRIVKLLSIVTAVFLSSCGDSDNSLPPNELTPFIAKAQFERHWKNSKLVGSGNQFIQLRPFVTEDALVIAGRDGIIAMLDQATGKIVRKANIGSIISAGVGGDSDLAVVSTRNGEIVSLELSSLKVRWRNNINREVLATPIIINNRVVVRSTDGNILALDKTTGGILWSYKQVLPNLTLRGSSEPVISQNILYTGLENGRVIAISILDGEVIWDLSLAVPKGRSEIERLVDIDGDSELYGEVLYATSFQGRIAAVDVRRSQILWARPFSSNVGLTVDSKAVYSTDELSHIWALDRFTGATLWKQDKLQARNVTRPVLFGEYLLVGDYAGYVHVISKFDGSFVARFKTKPREIQEFETTPGIIVPPIIVDDHIYVTGRDGDVTSLQLRELKQ